MDLRKRYRAWLSRRLAFLIPSLLAAFGVLGWLGVQDPFPAFLRLPCLTVATLVTVLVGYLLLQTLKASSLGRRRPLQETRARRRELRPWAPILGVSLFLLAGLVRIPALFPPPAAPPPLAGLWVRLRRSAAPPSTPPEAPSLPLSETDAPGILDDPKESPSSLPAASTPVAASPAPVLTETNPSKPDIRPELALEPTHLVLDLQELRWVGLLEIPIPKTAAGGDLSQAPSQSLPEGVAKELPKTPPQDPPDIAPGEEGGPPIRLDRDLPAAWPSTQGWLLGLTYRPLPDEQDTETWPFPEGRVEGFLLVGSGGDRVPGIALLLDLPLGRKDSMQVSWTGARLAEQDGRETSAKPDWDHVSLGYFRRVAGYTRHATFDLGVSLGLSADFFHAVEGVADSGGSPKFAPYAAIDLAFWQHQPIGLLLHFSEAFPVTLVGSSLGTTDMSAQIRWDLSERVSLHGGYRILLLRYKFDGTAPALGTDPLHEALSGPMLGLDVRF